MPTDGEYKGMYLKVFSQWEWEREREGVIFDQSFRGRVVKEKSESEFDVSGESQNILQNSKNAQFIYIFTDFRLQNRQFEINWIFNLIIWYWKKADFINNMSFYSQLRTVTAVRQDHNRWDHA